MFSQWPQESDEEMDINDCILCADNSPQLILWLRQNQYRKQNNFQAQHIRVISHILFNSKAAVYIKYKQALLRSTSVMGLDVFEYKVWGRIVNEIKSTILKNLQMSKGGGYDKTYIHSEIMLKNQFKKKLLATQKFQEKYNVQRINPINTQRSNRLPSGYEQKILLNSQLRTCYDFYPVDKYEKNSSKRKPSNIHQSTSQSQMEMQRLRNQLSIMIYEIKQLDDVSDEKNKNPKPFLDCNKFKEEIKFKAKLAANYSDIIQNQHNKKETNIKVSNIASKKQITQNHRMYTSPDLGKANDSNLENKYAEMYGCLLEKESQGKGVSKGKNKKGDTKMNYTDMKNKIKSINGHHKKNSQLTPSSKTTVSGGDLANRKSKSKSKLKAKPSLSSTANTLTVSSPRNNTNQNRRLVEVKSVSRSKLGDESKSLSKSIAKRVQKEKA